MQHTMPNLHCYTCTVGKKPSEAQAYLNDIDEVSCYSLLQELHCYTCALLYQYTLHQHCSAGHTSQQLAVAMSSSLVLPVVLAYSALLLYAHAVLRQYAL
jgi:hypothetical protein